MGNRNKQLVPDIINWGIINKWISEFCETSFHIFVQVSVGSNVILILNVKNFPFHSPSRYTTIADICFHIYFGMRMMEWLFRRGTVFFIPTFNVSMEKIRLSIKVSICSFSFFLLFGYPLGKSAFFKQKSSFLEILLTIQTILQLVYAY